jgi:hypothetical protein
MGASADLSPSTAPSRVVVVAGSGRSGTSTIAGVLKTVGLRIPPPEIPGNRSNPRGFFEPRWAVDFQAKLLRRAWVAHTDARPAAFDAAAAVGNEDAVRAEVGEWVKEHLAEAPELLIKDPRNSWFLPMWRQAAADAGADIAFLTMLRHPAEVVGSKDKYYSGVGVGSGQSTRHLQTTRVAGWLNVALFTEAATRDGRRTFVLYNDLLDDWRAVVRRVVTELDLHAGRDISDEVGAEVDDFVDPGLRRVRTGWDEIECPDDVRELAEETWQLLTVLAGSGGFDDAAQSRLDELRSRYVQMYADAEALAQSSAATAKRAGVREGRREGRKLARKAGAADAPVNSRDGLRSALGRIAGRRSSR